MAYTDEQLKNFSQIAYVDFGKAYEVLCERNPGVTSFSISDLEKVTKELYPDDSSHGLNKLSLLTQEEKDNWKISAVHDQNSKNGFYACVIETSAEGGDAVVAFRGSESAEEVDNLVNDWIGADFGLLNNTCTNQQAEVERFLNKYKDKLSKYDTLTMTGHSLGGNLAEYATVMSYKYGLDDNITQCVSLDGPGFSNEFILANYSHIEKMSGVMKHYKWSVVGNLLFQLPGVEYIDVQVENKDGIKDYNVFTRHDTKYLKFDENGNLVEGETDLFALAVGNLSKYVDSFTTNIFLVYITYVVNLFGYVASGEATKKLVEFFKNIINKNPVNYLKVDISRLLSDSDKLKYEINSIITEIDSVQENVTALGTMWKGTASDAFAKAFNEDYLKIKEYMKTIEKYIDDMVSAADAYNSCEQSVLSMVENMRT